MSKFISINELFDAYYSCKKHKRNKNSALQYELNFISNNLKLLEELNNNTYSPSESIAFCITNPKLREVFAANFRDRIVHHLLVNKINPYLDNYLTENTYACIKNRGTLYGIKKVKELADNNKNGWYLKCDIQGFFMSINKDILFQKVSKIILENIKYKTNEWINLAKIIIYHRPEQNCEIHGNKELFKLLPNNKTLFKSNGKGLPIGNLTSQIFANIYMMDFDKWMINKTNGQYGRYVDDFILFSNNKKYLLSIIKEIKNYLKNNLDLTLHPNKIVIQPVIRGITFIGYFIKNNCLHSGKRIKHNSIKLVDDYNLENVERFVRRINSYYGLLRQGCTYNFRKKLWKDIISKEDRLKNINMIKISIK